MCDSALIIKMKCFFSEFMAKMKEVNADSTVYKHRATTSRS